MILEYLVITSSCNESGDESSADPHPPQDQGHLTGIRLAASAVQPSTHLARSVSRVRSTDVRRGKPPGKRMVGRSAWWIFYVLNRMAVHPG